MTRTAEPDLHVASLGKFDDSITFVPFQPYRREGSNGLYIESGRTMFSIFGSIRRSSLWMVVLRFNVNSPLGVVL